MSAATAPTVGGYSAERRRLIAVNLLISGLLCGSACGTAADDGTLASSDAGSPLFGFVDSHGATLDGAASDATASLDSANFSADAGAASLDGGLTHDGAADTKPAVDSGGAGGGNDSADVTADVATDVGVGPDTSAPTLPCGDGTCSDVEVIPLCAIDCDPMSKQVWTCAAKACTAQRAACTADAACMDAWQTTMLCMKACGFQTSCLSVCAKEMLPSVAAKALGACALPGCMGGGGGSCGDGTCQTTETQQSCPTDCTAPAVCGDGTCEGGESPQSCPTDCKESGATCGDEQCDVGENATACPLDCEADAAAAWSCMQSHCASEKAACQGDTSCLTALNDAAICLKKCGGGSSCAQQCQGPVVGNSKALSLGICALQQCQTP